MVRSHDGDFMDDEACCVNHPHPGMAPGQVPYTCEELARVNQLIQDAADGDPGEEWEDYG